MATNNAREIFEQLLAGMKKNAEEYLNKKYNKLADEALATVGMTLDEERKHYEQKYGRYPYQNYSYMFEQKFLTYSSGYPQMIEARVGKTAWDKWVETDKVNHKFEHIFGPIIKREDIIAAKIKEDIDAMYEGFIQKQTKKVDGIIKGRAVEVTGKITGTLECYLTFKMEDGARFDMKTQIVWHMNQQGTSYWQFPSTMHNAYKANGEKLGLPSEAKLKNEL